MTSLQYDFSFWVIKYGTTIYGRTYQDGCLDNNDGMIVPLCWNHRHHDPDSVLGTAILEKCTGGIYAYCTLNNTNIKSDVIKLLRDKGSVSSSLYINQIIYNKDVITSAVIREVSLVAARIDSDECYYPVLQNIRRNAG